MAAVDEKNLMEVAQRIREMREITGFTVDEMARTMGLGKVTFIKRFTAEMGRPPKEFLNRMRAAAAARTYGFGSHFFAYFSDAWTVTVIIMSMIIEKLLTSLITLWQRKRKNERDTVRAQRGAGGFGRRHGVL